MGKEIFTFSIKTPRTPIIHHKTLIFWEKYIMKKH